MARGSYLPCVVPLKTLVKYDPHRFLQVFLSPAVVSVAANLQIWPAETSGNWLILRQNQPFVLGWPMGIWWTSPFLSGFCHQKATAWRKKSDNLARYQWWLEHWQHPGPSGTTIGCHWAGWRRSGMHEPMICDLIYLHTLAQPNLRVSWSGWTSATSFARANELPPTLESRARSTISPWKKLNLNTKHGPHPNTQQIY